MDYVQNHDHEDIKGAIGDIRIYDNSNYPMTIDPNKMYNTSHAYPNHEIMGPRNDFDDLEIMKFECTLFSNPLHNACPHQRALFDKNIKLHLNSIKFNFM